MPAYNFQSRFAHLVEAGTKRQTVRRVRKRPTRTGDTLYLYTGLRTAQARLLRKERCIAVRSLIIWPDAMVIAGVVQSPESCEGFARADGFADWGEFVAFFIEQYGIDLAGFDGEVISW